MPKTSTERSKAFRKRLREDSDKYKEYKKKDRERNQQARKTKTVSIEEQAAEREKCRERVRQYRKRKREEKQQLSNQATDSTTSNSAGQPYKTPQALGKAVQKVRRSLPKSPRKIKAVVNQLASTIGMRQNDPCINEGLVTSNRKLPAELVKLIESYYLRDFISRQAPGIRDYVTVRQEGKKIKLQKRHLMLSLREVHALFLTDNPNVEVSFSKFCSLRPDNVLLFSKMPRNVCLCQHHDNVNLLCSSIHKVLPEFPSDSTSLVSSLVCDADSEECMTGKCNKCPKLMQDILNVAPLDNPMEWFQWKREECRATSKKGQEKVSKRMMKVQFEGTIEEAIKALSNKMSAFLDHVFVKRQQSKFFEKKISCLKENEVAVQVDFSENYTCLSQDEIQSAHWNQNQVTVFPVVMWSKNGASAETVVTSHATIRDDRSHDKNSVAVFMDKVFRELVKSANPAVQTVDVFSDGPSSQFKNKYIAHFLSGVKESTGLNVKWHYFATSHGKGAVDGVGGTVKRSVWHAVLTRQVPVVDSADSFVRVATDVCTLATKISLITCAEIKELARSFNFQDAPALTGIFKAHCLQPKEDGTVSLYKYSAKEQVPSMNSDSNDSSSDGDSSSDLDWEVSEGYCNSVEDDDGSDGDADSDKGDDSSDGDGDSDRGDDSSDGEGDNDGDDNGSDKDRDDDGENEEVGSIPSVHIEKEQYYAVEFVDRFYYGRALAIDGNMVTFKFLHSKQCAGVMQFYWPLSKDIATVNSYCVFYGPVELKGVDPFSIKNHREISKLFSILKKQRNA